MSVCVCVCISFQIQKMARIIQNVINQIPLRNKRLRSMQTYKK